MKGSFRYSQTRSLINFDFQHIHTCISMQKERNLSSISWVRLTFATKLEFMIRQHQANGIATFQTFENTFTTYIHKFSEMRC